MHFQEPLPLHGGFTARLASTGSNGLGQLHGPGVFIMHTQFLRIKKLTGKAIIDVASRHNLREIVAEMGPANSSHIDSGRTKLNRILCGGNTAASIAGQAQMLMAEAGVKTMRKDAVRALEIIFSLPPHWAVDQERFFNESVQWVRQYFGTPVISAVVHNDEAAPHCHVLLLPMVNGRMIGSDLMGGRARLKALQADFHAQVAHRYGLARQTAQKRHSAVIRRQAIDSAFGVLEANSGLKCDVLRVLLDPHLSNPEPLMVALGLDMPTPKVKGTFAGIMTKPCKPDKERKSIGFVDMKPIGFIGISATEKRQTLCSVGFVNSVQPISPDFEQRIKDAQGDYIRQRDTETSSEYWDSERGEFIKQPAKISNKYAVVESVRAALNKRSIIN
jgi:hypothetical protein